LACIDCLEAAALEPPWNYLRRSPGRLPRWHTVCVVGKSLRANPWKRPTACSAGRPRTRQPRKPRCHIRVDDLTSESCAQLRSCKNPFPVTPSPCVLHCVPSGQRGYSAPFPSCGVFSHQRRTSGKTGKTHRWRNPWYAQKHRACNALCREQQIQCLAAFASQVRSGWAVVVVVAALAPLPVEMAHGSGQQLRCGQRQLAPGASWSGAAA